MTGSNPHFKNTELSYLLENRKSPVLYVKGIENREITIKMLYNLFSNFGNILNIIYIKNK